MDWANESFAIAIAPATAYCVAEDGGCGYAPGNVELDQDEPEKQVAIDAAYVAMSTPIIRDRLKRAGRRPTPAPARRVPQSTSQRTSGATSVG